MLCWNSMASFSLPLCNPSLSGLEIRRYSAFVEALFNDTSSPLWRLDHLLLACRRGMERLRLPWTERQSKSWQSGRRKSFVGKKTKGIKMGDCCLFARPFLEGRYSFSADLIGQYNQSIQSQVKSCLDRCLIGCLYIRRTHVEPLSMDWFNFFNS